MEGRGRREVQEAGGSMRVRWKGEREDGRETNTLLPKLLTPGRSKCVGEGPQLAATHR